MRLLRAPTPSDSGGGIARISRAAGTARTGSQVTSEGSPSVQSSSARAAMTDRRRGQGCRTQPRDDDRSLRRTGELGRSRNRRTAAALATLTGRRGKEGKTVTLSSGRQAMTCRIASIANAGRIAGGRLPFWNPGMGRSAMSVRWEEMALVDA